MALHPNFPESPYAILDPAIRWFPADEALRESSSDKLMPPLVPQLRRKVKEWRADVVSYAKNYLAVHFKLDYVNAHGDISNYYPDFLVKLSATRIVIVETKGQEDLDVPLKMERLRQWCEDINRVQSNVTYDFVYVDEESFEKYKPASFRQLVAGFREYKEKI